MSDFERIKSNVELMAGKGAPVSDIDGYLASEGYTPEKFKSAQAPSLGSTFLNSIPKGFSAAADSVLNLGPNVLNLGKMAVGTAATALGRPDLAPDVSEPRQFTREGLTGLGAIRPSAEPQDTAGRIVDMTGQALGGGGVNPASVVRNLGRRALLPVARDVTAAAASGAGAGTGMELASNLDTGSEAGNTALRTTAALLGGAAPGTAVAARGTGGDRAAAALKGVTPQQLALARELAKKAADAGSPVTGYEAIQAVTGINPKMQTQQRVAEQSDAAASALTPMMQSRPANNAALFERNVGQVAPPEARPDALAGLLQQGATDAIKTAHKLRSDQASPSYQAQRLSDAEAMGLQEAIPSIAARVEDRVASRNDVVQQKGQMEGYANEMSQKAAQYSPVPGYPTFPKRYTNQNDRAQEATASIPDFEAVRKTRLQEINASEQALNTAQDALASKNLPEISKKVAGYLSDLDAKIKLAGPTAEGKILRSLREEVAPNGEPILYPSQLESVYKANRNKTQLNALPTSEEKTVAGVIGPHVKALDNLIKDISPDIAAGRAKYAELSRDVVSPMEKGQIGKLTRSDEFPQQAATLLPEKPFDVTPAVIRETLGKIEPEAPGVPARFLAQYLRGTFNEANGGGVGNNPMGGYNFAKKVADNPMQRDNLVQALKSSNASPTPITDALDVFQAQGFKPAVNSATSSNMAEASLMGGSKMADLFMRPLKAIPGAVDSYRNGWATKALAESLSSGSDSVKRLEDLARINGAHSPVKQQLLINLLLANPANQATR